MLSEFKEIVDRSSSPIADMADDTERICNYLAIDTTNGFASRWITEKLQGIIKEILVPDLDKDRAEKSELTALREGLMYDFILNGTDNLYYLSVLNALEFHHHAMYPLSDRARWQKAIPFAMALMSFDGDCYMVSRDNLRQKYPRIIDVADAALKLKEMNCDVRLDGVVLRIERGIEGVVESIERDIQKLGAIKFIAALTQLLIRDGFYFRELKIYAVFNKVSMFSDKTRPMVPYGYLLNLAVKHVHCESEKLSGEKATKLFDEVIQRAIVLVTALDIRYYGVFEMMLQKADNLPEFISELALFDSAFSFHAYNEDDILEYMSRLFHWLDKERFCDRNGFAVDDLLSVSRSILSMAPENGPAYIYFSKLKKIHKELSAEQLSGVLASLSHDIGTVNHEYSFVHQFDKVDFGFRPLIKMSGTKFLLCDRSWCAGGFYEVLAALARKLDTRKDECNNAIGGALEEYIYSKLRERGINYTNGDYSDGSGEVDVVIESGNSIVLIETKKKVLTRKSKTGFDVKLLIDLTGSLLDAQLQAGRSELLLLKKGYLELEQGGMITRIVHNGREIDRIALTQWDYGSFQDRSIIQGLLTNLLQKQYLLRNKSDKSVVKSFQSLVDARNDWENQYLELIGQDDSRKQNPFFNTWFLSLPQLLLVLKHAHNNDEFAGILKRLKHTTYGITNFYFEFYHIILTSGRT